MAPYHPLGIAELEEYNKYSSTELFIPGKREYISWYISQGVHCWTAVD